MTTKVKKATKKATKVTAKTKKNTKQTFVTLVLDKSGSMEGVRKQAVSSINEQIQSLKKTGKLGGKTVVNVIFFDRTVDVRRNSVPVDDLTDIKLTEYTPEGTTALMDAINTAITLMQKEKETSDTAYLVCTITDGFENASTQISAEQLRTKIAELEKTGKWTFSYMLGHLNTASVIDTLGARVNSIATYSPDSAGTAKVGMRQAKSLGNYMLSVRGQGLLSSDAFYGDDADSLVPLVDNTKV